MKKVIIGFIAGALFATAGTAAASTIIEKVTASVRADYSVEVDGQKVVLENAPLAYKGSAYIAVREISNVIGKNVGFEDGVIKINSKVVDDQHQSLGGTPVNELNPNLIESAIEATEGMIKLNKMTLNNAGASEELKEEARKEIERLEQRLSELQARKAELEAQQ